MEREKSSAMCPQSSGGGHQGEGVRHEGEDGGAEQAEGRGGEDGEGAAGRAEDDLPPAAEGEAGPERGDEDNAAATAGDMMAASASRGPNFLPKLISTSMGKLWQSLFLFAGAPAGDDGTPAAA